MNKVVVVDKTDKPIALKAYSELRYEDIYRVSALWLTDAASGDCLITQRKWTKTNEPGKWMAAVSGTIEENETYDENIVHEIEEEIGLTGLKLATGPKKYADTGSRRFFVQWYVAETDKNSAVIRLQEEEVEDYRWVSKSDLRKDLLVNSSSYVPSFFESAKLLGYL